MLLQWLRVCFQNDLRELEPHGAGSRPAGRTTQSGAIYPLKPCTVVGCAPFCKPSQLLKGCARSPPLPRVSGAYRRKLGARISGNQALWRDGDWQRIYRRRKSLRGSGFQNDLFGDIGAACRSRECSRLESLHGAKRPSRRRWRVCLRGERSMSRSAHLLNSFAETRPQSEGGSGRERSPRRSGNNSALVNPCAGGPGSASWFGSRRWARGKEGRGLPQAGGPQAAHLAVCS